MENKILNTVLFFMTFLLVGCGRQTLQSEDYIKWIEDSKNGLVKTETYGKVKYTVAYRPADYNKAKSLLNNDSFQITNSNKKNHSFIIKMEPVDGKTQVLVIDAIEKQEPFQRINYYLSEAQNHIKLIEGNDTLPSTNYIYERYYNLSPSQNMVIGFEQKQALGSNDLVFILEDKIFNTGKIAFNFNQKTLKNIPILKTK